MLILPAEGQADDVKEQVAAVKKAIEPPEADVIAALLPAEKTAVDGTDAAIKELKSKVRHFDAGLLASDRSDAAPATHVLAQGDYRSPREEVVPGFPSALDPNPAAIVRGANAKTQGRRLTLARWIASPDNPLTARVIVNRLWQMSFRQRAGGDAK